MNIRRVEFKDERNKEERESMEEVRCFLSNIRWRQEVKDEEGGITWIELFALYMGKGAGDKVRKKQAESPLQGHQSLQKAIAAFKVRCRRVRTFCIEEGDEEQLATSYSQTNRLKPMGIENMHAAIKGLPVLEEEDARMVTQAILAMRGVNQRRHKEQHEEGSPTL